MVPKDVNVKLWYSDTVIVKCFNRTCMLLVRRAVWHVKYRKYRKSGYSAQLIICSCPIDNLFLYFAKSLSPTDPRLILCFCNASLGVVIPSFFWRDDLIYFIIFWSGAQNNLFVMNSYKFKHAITKFFFSQNRRSSRCV